jgi:hypothetical protein
MSMRILYTIALAAFALVAVDVARANDPGVTIGYVNPQTGQSQLLNGALKKQFVDGGPIQRFAVRLMGDGYNLIRAGKDAAGHCRTEALHLSVVGNQLRFKPATWFFVCSSDVCDDNNPDEWIEPGPNGEPGYLSQGFGICSPNHWKTSCECIGNRTWVTTCDFGIDVSGMGYEHVVIGP